MKTKEEVYDDAILRAEELRKEISSLKEELVLAERLMVQAQDEFFEEKAEEINRQIFYGDSC